MSDVEDRLRLLKPRPLSAGLWGRVSAGHIPFRTRKFMIGGAMLVVASGMLAFLAYVLLSPLPKGSTATPAQAEETAEGIFKKIEESIAKAKTVRVRCRTSSKMQVDPFKGECTLVFRQDDKAFAKMADLVILSDGATTRITGGSAGVIEKAAPKSLHDDLSTLLARAGMWQAISRGLLPGSSFANFAKDQPPLQKAYAAGGFSAADGDGSAKAFTYKLKLSFRSSVPGVDQNEQTALVEQDVAVKVWYAPANLRMVKRTLEFNTGLTLTEDYDEFSFDVEIPDETFNLKR